MISLLTLNFQCCNFADAVQWTRKSRLINLKTYFINEIILRLYSCKYVLVPIILANIFWRKTYLFFLFHIYILCKRTSFRKKKFHSIKAMTQRLIPLQTQPETFLSYCCNTFAYYITVSHKV